MKNIAEKKYSLKVNAIFNALYQILALLTPLITMPYISRVFNVSTLGDYNFYYSILGYFTLIAAFGFNDYGTKVISENRDDKEKEGNAFWGIFISKGILSFACLIVYIVLSFVIYHGNQKAIILLMSMSMYIVTVMIDPAFYFQGKENFVSICIRNTIVRILTLVCTFLFVKGEGDLYLYSVLMSASNLFAMIVMDIDLARINLPKPNVKELLIWNHMKRAFPFFIPTVASTLFTSLNQTMVGAFSTSTESGYYSQGIKMINLLVTLTGSLTVIIFSRMSYLFSKGDQEEIKRKIGQTFEAFWAVALPLTFGICAINETFIPMFFGSGYDGAINVVYITAPIIILSPINSLYGSLYYRPNNKIWIQTFIICFSSLVNVILCFLLIPSSGAVGSSLARLIAEFVQLPLLMYYACKTISPKIVFDPIIKTLDNSMIMFICVFGFGKLMNGEISSLLLLILEVVIGVFVYGALELITKDKFVYDTWRQISGKIKAKIQRSK